MGLTERQFEILKAFERTGSFSEAGRSLGLSRQRVHKFIKDYRSGKIKGSIADYSTDKGCPDGEHPSCLSCPLEKCKYEDEDD